MVRFVMQEAGCSLQVFACVLLGDGLLLHRYRVAPPVFAEVALSSHRGTKMYIDTMRGILALCLFVAAAAATSKQQPLEPLTKFRAAVFARKHIHGSKVLS